MGWVNVDPQPGYCKVPHCPAEAMPGRDVCEVHVFAKQAPHDAVCVKCKRKISKFTDRSPGDWVLNRPESRYTVKVGEYQHAVCPSPTVSRKKGPKELLELIDGTDDDRGTVTPDSGKLRASTRRVS
jgi:hypothetical protein